MLQGIFCSTGPVREAGLRVLSCSHAGIVEALNLGLQACTAGYIARMDADDLARPQRLELQAAYLDAHPEACLVSCRVAGFPDGQVREGFSIYIDWLNSLLSDEDIRREIFVESPLPHPSVMLRREWLQRVGSYQEHGWAEDYDLWLRLYLAGGRFAKLEQVLLEWREHPGRLTRTDERYSLENFLRAKAYYLALGPWRAGCGDHLGRRHDGPPPCQSSWSASPRRWLPLWISIQPRSGAPGAVARSLLLKTC